MLFTVTLFLCVSCIEASDVNITDSDDDLEDSQDLESDTSNILSTNKNEISLNETSQAEFSNTNESYTLTLSDSSSGEISDDEKLSLSAESEYSPNTTLNSENILTSASDDYLSESIDVSSTVKADNITKYYKGSTQYVAAFLDSSGNALADTDVTIKVGSKTYTRTTDINGTVSLSLNLKPGTYSVTAVNPDTGYELTTTFKVLSTISAKNINKVAGSSKKFKAKFFKSNGKALAGKKIKFKLNGKTYKVKTNSKGVASLSLKKLKKGTYKIVCYNKDGLSKTYKIKVYKKPTAILKTNVYTFNKNDSSKVIKVKLTNSLKTTLSGKTIKITVNKKTYRKKTNSKGIVTLELPDLKKGAYTVKYAFGGSKYFKAKTVTSYVVVIDSRNVTLDVKSSSTFGKGAGSSFKVAVTAGGVKLINKKVTFEVDGKNYTKTTNAKGIAALPINLGIGDYTVRYSVDNDSYVDAESGSSNITVVKRISTDLKWKSKTVFTGSPQTYKITLKDSNGKALSGQTIKLKVSSKTYTAKTSSKGVAKFKVGLSIGSYKVKVKYAGNDKYVSDSLSKSVTVTYSGLKSGVNEINTISDLSQYLKSAKHCKVGTKKLKKLVKSLTKGLTSDSSKANAILNYVRDKISYSFYYNTKYGASGTLSAKKGNCVDKSHLLVAMFRTAGLHARYVHGKCTFSSGHTYGHVWTQVLIGKTWVCADATSSRNSLGKIANWNTKSYSLDAKYASLSF